MKRSFYVASKFKHAKIWRELRSCGYNITSSWIDAGRIKDRRVHAKLADRCLKEIRNSDFLLLFCRRGEVLRGALLEAGAALSLGKEVRCVGNCGSLSPVFKNHPCWSSYKSVAAALYDAGLIGKK